MSTSFFDKEFTKTKIKSDNVKFPEMAFGYFLGPFGALLASGIFSSFLNRYWTDILFLDEKLPDGSLPRSITTFLALLPLVSSILIVAGNLIVGQIIEHTHTKAGKARPWILLSSVILSVSCVIMFLVQKGSPVTKMILTAVAYNLYYSVAYPLYNTSNSTLIPVSTRNSNERGLLASLTNFAGLAVMGTGGMIFPMVIALFMGGWETPNVKAWQLTFFAVGVITFVFTVLQYYFTRERVTEEIDGGMESVSADESSSSDKKKSLSIKDQFSNVTSISYWWMVLVFYLLFQFGGAFKNLSVTYFCSQQFAGSAVGPDMAMSVINILGAVPMAVAMLFVWPLSNKIGKQLVVLAGLVIGMAGGVLAGLFPTNFVVVCIGVCLKSLGLSPAAYMILAMIADVLDYVEYKNGHRCDGLTMSIYSSLMAASTPVATGLFNAISGGGVNSGAVVVSYIWIETVAFAIGAVIMIFFNVEKQLKKLNSPKSN